MSNTKRLATLLPLAASALVALPGCHVQSEATQTTDVIGKNHPNVLFILIDDIGYGDIGCHGNPFVKTPNIDKICSESFQFENFTVSPCSAPTRAALMTGKQCFKSNVTHTIEGRSELDINSETIADVMKSAGYVTGIFGKWHLGHSTSRSPLRRGFDEMLRVPDDNQISHYDPILNHNGKLTQYKGYRTDIIFKEATDFIVRNKNKQFFCYLPTYAAHAPHVVPKKYSDPYEGKDCNANYYGMISNVDENIGRLMAKLKELGIDKNTLVIFMNDNGTTSPDTYNAGMRGRKGVSWYGGIRASSFWRWPGVLPVEHCDQMTAHVDVFPTIGEIGGATIAPKTKADLEGISLVRYFKNPNATDLDRIAIHHKGRWLPSANYAIHKYADVCVTYKDFTLVRMDRCHNPECSDCTMKDMKARRDKPNAYGVTHFDTLPRGHWALYNIKYDRAQMRDLSAFYPEITKKLANEYENWWKDVEHRLDVYSKDPEVQKGWHYADEHYGIKNIDASKKAASKELKAELAKHKKALEAQKKNK